MKFFFGQQWYIVEIKNAYRHLIIVACYAATSIMDCDSVPRLQE